MTDSREEGNNLNGIEATRSGRFLIAVQSSTGTLWRIDARTGNAKAIDLGGAKLTNGDGLLLEGRTLLVGLRRGFASGRVARVARNDDFDVPTTIGLQGRLLYAVHARFGIADPASAEFGVTRVL